MDNKPTQNANKRWMDVTRSQRTRPSLPPLLPGRRGPGRGGHLLRSYRSLAEIQAPHGRAMKPANASESSPPPPREERAGERRPSSQVLPFIGRIRAPDERHMKPPNASESSPSPPPEERAGVRRP